MPTVSELSQEIFKLLHELGAACNRLEVAGVEYAIAENKYRKAKAIGYLHADGKTIDHKKAQVDLACENERLAAHIAKSNNVSAYERVKSLRAQLSGLQTISASVRVELETLNTQDQLGQHDQPPFDPDSPIPF